MIFMPITSAEKAKQLLGVYSKEFLKSSNLKILRKCAQPNAVIEKAKELRCIHEYSIYLIENPAQINNAIKASEYLIKALITTKNNNFKKAFEKSKTILKNFAESKTFDEKSLEKLKTIYKNFLLAKRDTETSIEEDVYANVEDKKGGTDKANVFKRVKNQDLVAKIKSHSDVELLKLFIAFILYGLQDYYLAIEDNRKAQTNLQLFDAIRNGDIQAFDECVKKGADLTFKVNEINVLSSAAKDPNKAFVKHLWETICKKLNTTDQKKILLDTNNHGDCAFDLAIQYTFLKHKPIKIVKYMWESIYSKTLNSGEQKRVLEKALETSSAFQSDYIWKVCMKDLDEQTKINILQSVITQSAIYSYQKQFLANLTPETAAILSSAEEPQELGG